MDKSRQRKHPTLKSSLNWVRESMIFAISTVLWIYCVTVLVVYVGTLFDINTYAVQLIRTSLNVDTKEFLNIFQTCAIFVIIQLIFLTYRYIKQKWKQNARKSRSHQLRGKHNEI
ncbi:intracellular adhesion protein IcaD [Staphylococcus massiliensis]|uniref:intracellular adhesion protein IcaD n=1 Tax=Staphylococcus massiliensis TaxID=555791 RepID=UPI001EDFAD36|nr:intracellular adhesion protein IcaD [Staphylococcus massiliensis]MCG3400409.1 intracellular adhesion protein D [Staphylococcus massiliensis]MCG3401746.1 intracellular adhesion protein D [Staphylococcus massiliensis]